MTTAAPQRHVLLRITPFVLIIFCGYLPVGMPLAALPLQVHDALGFGNLVVGSIIGLQSVVTLVTRPMAGSLCDRSGPKSSVLLGGTASVAASVIYFASTFSPFAGYASLGLLLAARTVSGLAESLLMTGALAWAIAVVGVQNTGKVMVWVGIGMYTAIAAGAPLGIALMSRDGAAYGFAAVSVGMIVFSVLAIAAATFIAPVAAFGGERLPFMKVVGRIAPCGMGLALATIGFGAIGTFDALDFQHQGWPGEGYALTGFGVAYVLTRLALGGWPDRFGGARVAVWSLAIECFGQIMLWLAPQPIVAFAGTILTGIGYALVFPSFGIEAVKRVPPVNRGAALGAYVAFFDVGFGVAGPTTGLLAGAFGYASVFVAGAFAAASAIVVARVTREAN
jgi:MFS family permease